MHSVVRACLVPLGLVVALSLVGCGGSTDALEPILSAGTSGGGDSVGRRMIGEPYKVGGRWYHPREDESYDEAGFASWYGPGFHGNSTANGERFDMNALTAAHPTLPLPSYVRVTVKSTGKSAVLRVNDRGPFHRGRIIDVSKAAADRLGFRQDGRAKVRVEYLGPAPIGGGDRETRMAEAKYGTKSSRSSAAPRRGVLPFGFGRSRDEPDDERPVEVRLAAAAPAPPVTTTDALPGVHVPTVYRPAAPPAPHTAVAAGQGTGGPGSGTTAVAYSDGDSAAMEALVTMKVTGEEEDAAPAPAAAPLPAAVVEASDARVSAAHELFGAIDTAAGGAGELTGVAIP